MTECNDPECAHGAFLESEDVIKAKFDELVVSTGFHWAPDDELECFRFIGCTNIPYMVIAEAAKKGPDELWDLIKGCLIEQINRLNHLETGKPWFSGFEINHDESSVRVMSSAYQRKTKGTWRIVSKDETIK